VNLFAYSRNIFLNPKIHFIKIKPFVSVLSDPLKLYTLFYIVVKLFKIQDNFQFLGWEKIETSPEFFTIENVMPYKGNRFQFFIRQKKRKVSTEQTCKNFVAESVVKHLFSFV